MINFRILLIFTLLMTQWSCSKDIDRGIIPSDGHVLCYEAIPNRDLSFGILPSVPQQRKLFFLGELGFTVGDSGTILKSDDGGITWDIKAEFDKLNPSSPKSLTEARLSAIYFPNANVGYAGGTGEYDFILKAQSDAVFLKTENGGDNWQLSTIDNARAIMDLLFFTEEEGIAMLEISNPVGPSKFNVYSTSNGGKNWRISTLAIKEFISDQFTYIDNKITFLAKNHKGEAVIVQSKDQGKTWVTYATPEKNCTKLHYFSDELSYVVCGDEVYQSDGIINNWNPTNYLFNQESFVHFFTPEEGFVIDPTYEWVKGGGESYLEVKTFEVSATLDGGISWSSDMLSSECEIRGIKYMDKAGVVYILNKNHEVVRIK